MNGPLKKAKIVNYFNSSSIKIMKNANIGSSWPRGLMLHLNLALFSIPNLQSCW
jgi:hypothetical protein